MDEKYMRVAIHEAKKAEAIGEMPVGAVIVLNNKIIGKGFNKKECSNDPTKHAEIIALKQASKKCKSWRLNKCSIYVTMEPCIMCLGAIAESRISNVIYGINNQKWHFINKTIAEMANISLKNGIFEDEIMQIMKNFFISIRNR